MRKKDYETIIERMASGEPYITVRQDTLDDLEKYKEEYARYCEEVSEFERDVDDMISSKFIPPLKKPRRAKVYDYEDFLRQAMEALEAEGKADFVLLKNDDLREWWNDEKKRQAAKLRAQMEKERKEAVKAAALAKLSDEEKELLGIKVR